MSPSSTQLAASTKPWKILLVDDEPETAAALREWLERRGYEPVYANGPEEADRALAVASFDVILSDIQMPGNFRLEWIEGRLQQECPPPVLLMTGDPKLETAMRAANLPVAGYLLKPLDYSQAAELIETLAQGQRHRSELLVISRDLARLLAARQPNTVDPLSAELDELARRLASTTQRNARRTAAPSDEQWRNAVAETIRVLEKTKHSFRSKELGELRRRLERLTPAQQPADRQLVCRSAAGRRC